MSIEAITPSRQSRQAYQTLREFALSLPGAYEPFPMDLMIEWIEESYRVVALRKFIAQLDSTRAESDLYS